jgi:hypothetical protein
MAEGEVVTSRLELASAGDMLKKSHAVSSVRAAARGVKCKGIGNSVKAAWQKVSKKAQHNKQIGLREALI